MTPPPSLGDEFQAAQAAANVAMSRLAATSDRRRRQAAYRNLLAARIRCTQAIHMWLAEAVELDGVSSPRMLLSLDVDGVLEDEANGFTSTDLTGALALRLLQEGQVGVVLNTARGAREIEERAGQFHLLGGVGLFGGVTWDNVFGRSRTLIDERARAQLDNLRLILGKQPDVVLDQSYAPALRASRLEQGQLRPISDVLARRLLDEAELTELTFWVGRTHTDFADRRADKATGLRNLLLDMGLAQLPLAAMGDARCDLPMLRSSGIALVPEGVLPGYRPAKGQRLWRCSGPGTAALWSAAARLVPNRRLQQAVISRARDLTFPEWFPDSLQRHPVLRGRRFSVAAGLRPIRRRFTRPSQSEELYGTA